MPKNEGFILMTLQAFMSRSMQAATKKLLELGLRHPEYQAALRRAIAHNDAYMGYLRGDSAPAVKIFRGIEKEIEDLIAAHDGFAQTMSDALAGADEPELPRNWRPDSDGTQGLRELLGEFKEARRRLERRVREKKRRKRNS